MTTTLDDSASRQTHTHLPRRDLCLSAVELYLSHHASLDVIWNQFFFFLCVFQFQLQAISRHIEMISFFQDSFFLHSHIRLAHKWQGRGGGSHDDLMGFTIFF